jgi:anhydro-N-acetylmuramic acid kinase
MSGTSCDGISACLIEVTGSGLKTHVKLLSFDTYPYEKTLREELLELYNPQRASIEKLSRLNILLGRLFARAARTVAEKAHVPLEEIDLIGSHGHTAFHHPEPEDMSAALIGGSAPPKADGGHGRHLSHTLQIAEPSVIAQETGITTVADFRMRDVAVGGHGAPLVPYVDYLLFRDKEKGRALQNIGGIANVTFIPPGASLEDITAFDTGPGNMVMDRITQIITQGRLNFDEGGRLAAKGQVREDLLLELLDHPYLKKPPPKSTGREDFGSTFTEGLYKEAKKNPCDDLSLLATVTAFTAKSIEEGYRRFILPRHPIHEVIIYGGGSENETLVRFLKEFLHPIPVRRTEDFGIPSEAKEALSFAVLANETISGNPSNVPRATGARERVILGKIVPGRNWEKIL